MITGVFPDRWVERPIKGRDEEAKRVQSEPGERLAGVGLPLLQLMCKSGWGAAEEADACFV